jgi:iron-sulfur cluster assembly accessory protein
MLTLTEVATRKIQEVIAGQTEPVFGLRVSVEPSGCCGQQYAMSLASAAEEGDWVGTFGDVRVLVDPHSAPLLNGVQIDYVETLQASGFSITNPSATRGCGCGRSFETEGAAGETQASSGGCGCGGGGCGCGGH